MTVFGNAQEMFQTGIGNNHSVKAMEYDIMVNWHESRIVANIYLHFRMPGAH